MIEAATQKKVGYNREKGSIQKTAANIFCVTIDSTEKVSVRKNHFLVLLRRTHLRQKWRSELLRVCVREKLYIFNNSSTWRACGVSAVHCTFAKRVRDAQMAHTRRKFLN